MASMLRKTFSHSSSECHKRPMSINFEVEFKTLPEFRIQIQLFATLLSCTIFPYKIACPREELNLCLSISRPALSVRVSPSACIKLLSRPSSLPSKLQPLPHLPLAQKEHLKADSSAAAGLAGTTSFRDLQKE